MKLKIPVYDSYTLSLIYSPGVGESCMKIKDNIKDAYKYTNIGNSIAVVTDCTGFAFYGQQKWISDAAIPQLEAQCLFYKVYSNIDAYPFIIDLKECKTDLEFVEAVEFLSINYSGIEFYLINEERMIRIMKLIHERKKIQSFILSTCLRNQIRKALAQKKIDKILREGFLTAILFRAGIDCLYNGEIDAKLLDLLYVELEKNKNKFQIQWELATYLHEILVREIFKLKLNQNVFDQDYDLISRFSNYLFEGKKAWIRKGLQTIQGLSLNENSLILHQRYQGVIKTTSKVKMKSIEQMYQLIDTTNYEDIDKEIMNNPSKVYDLTFKNNWMAIITNGTAVLGFGDIGALAGMPVMEGKSVIFKQLGGVDVVPICIQEKDPKKFIEIVKKIAPIFSAINLEDIKAPECFEIEQALIEQLDIPVFHDDQHGTAIVVVAAVINSLKLMKKKADQVKLIINGAGAAGLSICELLLSIGIKNIIICDTKGTIYKDRKDGMNPFKDKLALLTNKNNVKGSLADVLIEADIFIGVSAAKALKPEWVKLMNKNNLILALANPVPEIMPDEAKNAGGYIVGTGRSDFKNQVNNSLAFPGIFRGVLDVKARKITLDMKLAAAEAIANLIPEFELTPDHIIPSSLDTRVPVVVAKAVAEKALQNGQARKKITSAQVEENISTYIIERSLKRLKEKK